MNVKNLSKFAAVTLFLLIGARSAFSADEHNTSIGLTLTGSPLAAHGYDPVAFFTVSAPTEGTATFATVYDGGTYYFSSKENLETFKANPTRYAPAFGGFCAYGVALGKKFDGDPRYWTIDGGTLYLNLNEDIQEKFRKDVPGNIAKATKNWQTIEHKSVKEL